MLLNQQYKHIRPLLVSFHIHNPNDARHEQFINQCIFKFKNGVPWHNLPHAFGNPNSLITRHRNWLRSGLWMQILTSMKRRHPDDKDLLLALELVATPMKPRTLPG